jgi:hypothetical protein
MAQMRNVTAIAVLIVALSGTAARSNENNCRRLESLAQQYAGVQLTSQQQQMKRRMVAYYRGNCGRMRSAGVWR